jgi:hypothetical protein
VLAASTAIAGYGVLDGPRSAGRSVVIAAVLMFVPLIVLGAIAVTALIETGILRSIAAGHDPFLRGRALDPWMLALAAPGLLPLAALRSTRLRAEATGALALGLGGLVASLALDGAAPILPLALASGLAAARGRPLLLALALALGSLAAMSPAAERAAGLPVLAPWRIDAETAEILPAWGVAETLAAAHRGTPPRLARVAGRYVLITDGATPEGN